MERSSSPKGADECHCVEQKDLKKNHSSMVSGAALFFTVSRSEIAGEVREVKNNAAKELRSSPQGADRSL